MVNRNDCQRLTLLVPDELHRWSRKVTIANVAPRGLVILPCGTRGNVIRFLLPLTGPDALIGEGLGIMETALVELVQAKAH